MRVLLALVCCGLLAAATASSPIENDASLLETETEQTTPLSKLYTPAPGSASVLKPFMSMTATKLATSMSAINANYKKAFKGVFSVTNSKGKKFFVAESALMVDCDGSYKCPKDSSHQSQLSYACSNKKYPDARTSPFYVVPKNGANFGLNVAGYDVAAVIYNGKITFATHLDNGPDNKFGEASVRVHNNLGNGQAEKSANINSGVITVIFPGSGTLFKARKLDPCKESDVKKIGEELWRSVGTGAAPAGGKPTPDDPVSPAGAYNRKLAAANAATTCSSRTGNSGCSAKLFGCCTDLVIKALAAGGFKKPLSRGAADMHSELVKKYGWKKTSCKSCTPGDVLYYPNLNGGKGHVAFCQENPKTKKGARAQWNPARCNAAVSWAGNDGVAFCLTPP